MIKRWASTLSLIFIVISGPCCHSLFGPEEPDSNWKVFESPHFLVHVRPNSFAEQNIVHLLEDLEAHYTYVLRTLKINYAGRIAVFLYDSPQDAGRQWVGGNAFPKTECAIAVCSAAYGIHTAAPHEITHVITQNTLGEPETFLMSEGTAMGIKEEGMRLWNGTHVHSCTQQLIVTGRLPSLNTLLQWSELDDDITYPASGSFILYILERFGPEPIKRLFNTPPHDFAAKFKDLCGLTIEETETAWKSYCLKW
jgi:hypothetical protein